jgi:hypothetical protein
MGKAVIFCKVFEVCQLASGHRKAHADEPLPVLSDTVTCVKQIFSARGSRTFGRREHFKPLRTPNAHKDLRLKR